MRRAVLAAVLLAAALPAAAQAQDQTQAEPQTRYSLVHGCYTLESADGTVQEPLRMQATRLAHYLLYTPQRTFVAAGLARDAAPSQRAVWRVDDAAQNRFTLTNDATGEQLHDVTFTPATGCADYPEAEVDATGEPAPPRSPLSRVYGTVTGHEHLFDFEFLGGDFHCGRPWHPYGVAYALPDCAGIQGPEGLTGVVQNFLDYGSPVHPHDTRGWPTFHDWPGYDKLAEEGDYYTGIERAWKAGLRLLVQHFSDNEALCALMIRRRNPCNDMNSVHIQRKDLFALQDYIDAQSGGPGKGWFRVVRTPFEARRVINEGKLAVVQGIEVSRVIGCGETGGAPQPSCTREHIDKALDTLKGLGIATFFPVHKFDNAFGGTKMDGGVLGPLVNLGNRVYTGSFWDVRTCDGPDHDRDQITALPQGLSDLLAGPLALTLPAGELPLYPPPPHCNQRGLTALGAYVLRGMMKRHMIVQVDHMDVRTEDAALSVLEAHHYSGVTSSHSWDVPRFHRRIYRLGGVVTAYGDPPPGFVEEWQRDRKLADPRYLFGYGYGADMNGIGAQSPPTTEHPISYPFTSYDGRITFDRERWGQRTFDINRDGVANYGMYADWLDDLRVIAGRPIARDMMRGAEAWLEMWERADGIRRPRRISRKRARRIALGTGWEGVLRHVGQPIRRRAHAFVYRVGRRGRGRAIVRFDAQGRVDSVRVRGSRA